MSPKTYPVHGKLPVAQLGVLGAAFVAGVLCSSLVLRSIPGTFDKLFVSRSSNPSTASLENSGAGQVPAEMRVKTQAKIPHSLNRTLPF
jgi:hypothetical protein